MASNNKRKTTMAKVDRESRLRDRRMQKRLKRDARKNAPPQSADPAPDAPAAEESDAVAPAVE